MNGSPIASAPCDLAVIIVTWNVRNLIGDALRTLQADLATSGLTHQIVVIDSASTDGTSALVRAEFPDVSLIASKENLGFGRANNYALKALGSGINRLHPIPSAILLLNPDTLTHAGATRALYDALMSDPKVGMVGARLSYSDGTFQHSAFAFPGLRQLWTEFFPTPGRSIEGTFNGRYPRALYNGKSPFPVDFVLGAAMMLRREVIDTVGMFDESYFMYCEEIDWAWRIHRAEWRIELVPSAHITHLGGQSTEQVKPQSIRHLWASRMQWYYRALPTWKRPLARALIYAGTAHKIQQLAKSLTAQNAALIDAYRAIHDAAAHHLPAVTPKIERL